MYKNIIIGILLVVIMVLGGLYYQAQHADINHDGAVNVLDFSLLAKHYGQNLHGLEYKK